MTIRAAWLVQHFYSGTPADKLAAAHRLHTVFAARPEDARLAAALAEFAAAPNRNDLGEIIGELSGVFSLAAV